MAMRRVADYHRAAETILLRDDRLDDPVTNLMHYRFEVGNPEQLPHARDDLGLVEVGIAGAEREVQNPFLRIGVVALGTHRHDRATTPRTAPFGIDEPSYERITIINI